MRTYEVSKDDYTFVYRELPSGSWQRFPDAVETPEAMEAYFMRGGFDKPGIIFSGTKDGKKLYQITRSGPAVVATVDHTRKLPFTETDFLPIGEQLEFLRIYSSRETDAEASSISDEKKLLEHYRKNADAETLSKLSEKISESITNTRIRELCREHCLRYFPDQSPVIEIKS